MYSTEMCSLCEVIFNSRLTTHPGNDVMRTVRRASLAKNAAASPCVSALGKPDCNAQCTTTAVAQHCHRSERVHFVRVRNPRAVPPHTPRSSRQWVLQLSLTILTLSLVTLHTFHPRRCWCCCLQLDTVPLCDHPWSSGSLSSGTACDYSV